MRNTSTKKLRGRFLIMISKKVCAVVILLALSISVAFADEKRSHQFDAKLVSSLKVDLSVGSIAVKHSDSEFIEVTVILRNESNGWFGRSQDLTKLDLDSRILNSELTLIFDEKHVKAEMEIFLPKTSELSINLGVGAVELLMVEAESVEINLGVGTIEIEMSEKLAGNLNLSAGVGDTNVQGAQQIQSKRAVVSSELNARGSGNTEVLGRVGIGSVSISLI